MLRYLTIIALASSTLAQGIWGPFDPRCPVVDDAQNPAHLPHETYCTKFYKCFDRMRVEFDCPPGLEWGHMDLCVGVWCACEWPWSAQCSVDNLPPLPTDIPTSSTTSGPAVTPPNICPEVDDPHNPVFLPHESTCDQYYVCHRGTRVQRSCAFGLFWDQENRWCNFPWKTFCQHDCPVPDDAHHPIFIPNYSFCDKYFLCFNGTKIPRTCADGLQWSREGDWCDYEENVRCGYTGIGTKAELIK